MTNYEIALVLGLFALSYYFLYFGEQFKIDGLSPGRALVKGIIGILLKMFSVLTIIFNVFFIKLILQDQTSTSALANILNLYDSYLTVFLYGFAVIFFVLFFIEQFILFLANLRIYKANKKINNKEWRTIV
jgi:hypothetical protein